MESQFVLRAGDAGSEWSIAHDRWSIEVAKLIGKGISIASVDINTIDTPLKLLPDGFEILVVAWPDKSTCRLLATQTTGGEVQRILRLSLSLGSENLEATAVSTLGLDDAQALVAQIVGTAKAVPPRAVNTVPVRFWALAPNGPSLRTRHLEVPTWSESRGNYASGPQSVLDALVKWESAPETSGNLLLFHGPPGTGKTSAIRVLAREWKPWCDVHYVVDPDRFFKDAYYMQHVLLDDGDKWRLIVVEDADEFLRTEAKIETGQAMSRLLNLCDGFVGQGLRVLMLLTTNEPIRKLHPAIIRPGRCLVDAHVDAFDTLDADTWRVEHGLEKTGKVGTLADLYAELNQDSKLQTGPTERRMGFATK